jgi:hypothetical protein
MWNGNLKIIFKIMEMCLSENITFNHFLLNLQEDEYIYVLSLWFTYIQ